MDSSVQEVLELLKSHANEDYAIRMKAYMKGHFDFFGVQAPQRKKLIKSFVQSHKKSEFHEIKNMVSQLWIYPMRDGQYVAMELLAGHLKKLEKVDLSFIESLISTKSWWDTVDWVAGHALGKYFMKFPEMRLNTIEKWMQTKDIWLKRSAIIHQLFYKEKTDHDLLAELILEQKNSKDYFINKASGWALRRYSKTNPQWVESFIEEHNVELSKLTSKEGMKWIEKIDNL